jgi:hypothetical protein
MSQDPDEEALVRYVNEHAGCAESTWDDPDRPMGLHPYIPIGTCQRGKFLELIRSHSRIRPACNPLDGQEHHIREIRAWLEPGAHHLEGYDSALRFISLGVGLGVFTVAPETWDPDRKQPQGPVNRESVNLWVQQRLQAGEECRFRCHPDPVES